MTAVVEMAQFLEADGGFSGDRRLCNKTIPKGLAPGRLWERLGEAAEDVKVYEGWLVWIDRKAAASGRGEIPGYGTPPGEYLTPLRPLPDWYRPGRVGAPVGRVPLWLSGKTGPAFGGQ